MHRQGLGFQLILIVMSALETEDQLLQFGRYLVCIQEKTVPAKEVVLEVYKIARGITVD